MTREEFIALVAPIAVKLRLEGSPIFPSVRIAQALLETGGKVNAWNNLVGYKVGSGQTTPYWTGTRVSASTWEVYEGVRQDQVKDDFRAYTSIENGFRDQDLLFQLARYTEVRQAPTALRQTEALQRSGYATDPNYALKLKQIMSSYKLNQYDEEVIRMLEQLREEIAQMQETIEDLQSQVNELEKRASMGSVPQWAQAAVDAAVAASLIDTPQGGSYDFYRLLTILHRKGIV